MPAVSDIKKAMQKKGIPAETMTQFSFPASQGNKIDNVISLIQQMDNLLTREQCLAVMEEQGCAKKGVSDNGHREFGIKHKDKSLEEKIALLHELKVAHKPPCRLNGDGTFSVFWETKIKGEDKFRCICPSLRKLTHSADIPATFCGCCGGHVKHHYQNSLGIELRLIKIVSSPLGSNGEKHCEFLFEIIDE